MAIGQPNNLLRRSRIDLGQENAPEPGSPIGRSIWPDHNCGQPKVSGLFPDGRQSGTLLATSAFDRHGGGGHPPTLPHHRAYRTRRFELVTLASIDQRWKSERCEVSVGKPHREGFGPGQIPPQPHRDMRANRPSLVGIYLLWHGEVSG